MRTVAVIGKNYGDEGKGLVTAGLCSFCANERANKALVVKHNGGAQAGHTVEIRHAADSGHTTEIGLVAKSGQSIETCARFVHHQIGSGAEYGADTLFAETYHPDLYQLEKEISEFKSLYGFVPRIFSEAGAKPTTIDDVLINMAIETKRGDARHGSCGMGINECAVRLDAGYELTMGEIASYTCEQFFERLKSIRKEYTFRRMRELEIDSTNRYYSLLQDENVLANFAKAALDNLSYIEIVNADKDWIGRYGTAIFETGQGLLLDKDFLQNAPHLTTSKTGIINSVLFLKKRDVELQEAIYASRSYVTRHGVGPLPNEFAREEFSGIEEDITNAPNEWQGSIRYARHTDIDDFTKYIYEDIKELGIKPSLVITHLNETDDKILFRDEDMPLDALIELLRNDFRDIYISRNHYDIEKVPLRICYKAE